ncbi:c-type cytochrome [Catenovulum sp. 2E275]|uniref:PVC-type heme-binding CxxCH protein n=1 Tax=Catenovulum sp. 2E275 TaxID=2980497 RepID=UPI0021D1C32B|nr:PVC-type heme-binding CxxCH protein [Catenovulum sp. 2E275]MCU4677628.1 c-type cytochrome [Catenovulum sp. 2E275]
MTNKNFKLKQLLCCFLAGVTTITYAADNTETNKKEIDKQQTLTQNPGDREGHNMQEVVPREVIPPAPVLNIDDAMKAFVVHPDFQLEVVANSPLVFDPVVAQYDAAGHLWVVEMTTFMPDADANGEMQHESQIVVLSDKNNDGVMDERQVILEKLLLPRALAFIKGGILWADSQNLYFTEISNQLGKFSVGKTDVIDAEYAASGNVEHKPNGLLYSLDNWYYSAKADIKYRPYPLTADIPAGSEEIYRNHLWKMVKARTEFRGQWGISQDDYGRHYFNFNSSPIQTTSFLPDAAIKNSKYKFPKSILEQPVGTTDVYPIRVNPGVNRGYLDGVLDEHFRLSHHTAACGPLIYRGHQFPQEYYGIGLVSEPAANLIKATRIVDHNGVVSGENLFEKQEIIASTDERFRPVNAYNSPDGTVTLVDFYHGIIQHRTYLTSYLREQITMRELERHKHLGRIYRLKHKNSPVKKPDYLDKLAANELIDYLGHNNGWHRDMAKQIIVMEQSKELVPALKKLAINPSNHLAQINALWTLEGLGAVDFAVLKQAAQSTNPKVLRSVYRLVAKLPQDPTINLWLLQQVQITNLESKSALELACGAHKAWQALATIINKFGISDFTFSALANAESEFLASQGEQISSQHADKITTVMNVKIADHSLAHLSEEQLASFTRGKALYEGEASCFGCHGKDGEGSAIVPPLNNSEWVVESSARLTAILLHGFTGEIEVNGKLFASPMSMPGLVDNANFDDQALADIATYIRNAWHNSSSAVERSDVANVRQSTLEQSVPYTTETIKNKFN